MVEEEKIPDDSSSDVSPGIQRAWDESLKTGIIEYDPEDTMIRLKASDISTELEKLMYGVGLTNVIPLVDLQEITEKHWQESANTLDMNMNSDFMM